MKFVEFLVAVIAMNLLAEAFVLFFHMDRGVALASIALGVALGRDR